MKQKTINTTWLPLIYGVAFAVLAWVILVVKNSDLLFTAQDRSIFLHTPEFLAENLAVPGGLLSWAGCYLIQFFITPWWGSAILIVMWLLIYWLTIECFNLKGAWSALALIPVCALLASIVDVGYWLYYLKVPGYWMKETLALLIVLLVYWGYKKVQGVQGEFKGSSKGVQGTNVLGALYIIVWTILGYNLLGWWALLCTLLMGLSKTALAYRLTALISLILVPWITYYHYSQFRIEDAWWVGFPLFQNDKFDSWICALPFFIIIVALIGFTCLKGLNSLNSSKGTHPVQLFFSVVLAALLGWGVCLANIDDYNFHAELRMHRAAMEQRWSDVLDDAGNNPGEPTREMVLLKNLALTQRNEFGDRFCHFGNGGVLPYLRDSLHVHLVQTCGPILYMYYGKENFATRWSIENEVEFGLSINKAKILTYAALISGETKLAEKYMSILRQTDFQHDWVARYEPILRNYALVYDKERYPEFAYTKEIYDNCGSVLDGDEGLVEMYLINYFSHTQNKDSKALNATTLNFACVGKDIQLFWPRFFCYGYLHKGETMPIHYQEAAYLYGNLEKEVDISKMPFDQEKVVKRYLEFQKTSQMYLKTGMDTKAVGQAMKSMYGDTFWWFYFFCRDVKSY